MITTAAPACARAMIASWIASAAPASTPQVGWLITSTAGSCITSRPTRNFCRLPPDSDRASAAGPVVRTSKPSMIRWAKALVRRRLMKPNRSSDARRKPDRKALSDSDMVVTAPCPLRSSGTKQPRRRRRSVGPMCPAATPPIITVSGRPARISPDSASISSACPLPAMPARPRISPPARLSEMPCRSVPNWLGERTVRRSSTSCAGAALALAGRGVGARSSALIMISASSLTVRSAGVTRATLRPSRMMVAAEQSARTSSSLWLIYRIEQPSAASRRRVTNSRPTSCGVSTEVGSSMISSRGDCSRQRTISMRCRSPTDRSCTTRSGSSGSPYSVEMRTMRSRSPSRSLAVARPRAMFSVTVSASNREKCWNTIPTPSRCAWPGEVMLTSSPSQVMRPASGFTRP